jgi:hypothetical protein
MPKSENPTFDKNISSGQEVKLTFPIEEAEIEKLKRKPQNKRTPDEKEALKKFSTKKHKDKQKKIIQKIKAEGSFPIDSIKVYQLNDPRPNPEIVRLNKIPEKTPEEENELKRLKRERNNLNQRIFKGRNYLIAGIVKYTSYEEASDEEASEYEIPAEYKIVFRWNDCKELNNEEIKNWELIDNDLSMPPAQDMTSQTERLYQKWLNPPQPPAAENSMQNYVEQYYVEQYYVETNPWDSQFPGNIYPSLSSDDMPTHAPQSLDQWCNLPQPPPLIPNYGQTYPQTYPWNSQPTGNPNFPHYSETPDRTYGTPQANTNYYITNTNNTYNFQIFKNNLPTEYDSAEPNTRNQFQNPGSDFDK